MSLGIPIVVLEGSEMSNEVIKIKDGHGTATGAPAK
jgi:hypothetical protein